MGKKNELFEAFITSKFIYTSREYYSCDKAGFQQKHEYKLRIIYDITSALRSVFVLRTTDDGQLTN